jgi:hypothetical protein
VVIREGGIHFLLPLPIEEENEDRWCLWRPDQAGFDSRLFLMERWLGNREAGVMEQWSIGVLVYWAFGELHLRLIFG